MSAAVSVTFSTMVTTPPEPVPLMDLRFDLALPEVRETLDELIFGSAKLLPVSVVILHVILKWASLPCMTVVAGLLAVILSILGTFLTSMFTLADFCVVPSSNSRVKLSVPKLKFAAGMVTFSFIVMVVPVVLPDIKPL